MAAVALSVAVSAAPALRSDDMLDRRTEVGARVFRALLAADLDLPKKTVGSNQILILFFYANDGRRAAELAQAFAANGDVHGLSVVAEATNDPAFAKYAGREPAGVFATYSQTRLTSRCSRA